jgi:hypothetical protein
VPVHRRVDILRHSTRVHSNRRKACAQPAIGAQRKCNRAARRTFSVTNATESEATCRRESYERTHRHRRGCSIGINRLGARCVVRELDPGRRRRFRIHIPRIGPGTGCTRTVPGRDHASAGESALNSLAACCWFSHFPQISISCLRMRLFPRSIPSFLGRGVSGDRRWYFKSTSKLGKSEVEIWKSIGNRPDVSERKTFLIMIPDKSL